MTQEKKNNNNNQLFHPVEPLNAHQMRSDPSLRMYLNRPNAVEIPKLYVRRVFPVLNSINPIQFQGPSRIQDSGPRILLHVFVFERVPGSNMPFEKMDETGWQSAMPPPPLVPHQFRITNQLLKSTPIEPCSVLFLGNAL